MPGDGIGPEVVAEAVKVLERLRKDFGLKIELETASVGGAAYESHKHPLPDATLKLAKTADAVLLGAVVAANLPTWRVDERLAHLTSGGGGAGSGAGLRGVVGGGRANERVGADVAADAFGANAQAAVTLCNQWIGG